MEEIFLSKIENCCTNFSSIFLNSCCDYCKQPQCDKKKIGCHGDVFLFEFEYIIKQPVECKNKNKKTNKYIVHGKRLFRIYLLLLFKDLVMFFLC